MTKVYSIAEHVVVSPTVLPKLGVNQANAQEIAEELRERGKRAGTRLLWISQKTLTLDYTKVAANALAILEGLLNGDELDASFFWKLPSAFASPIKLADSETGKPLFDQERFMPSFAVKHFYPSTGWPVENSMCGATVLMGDTGSGKSFYSVHKSGADVVVRFSEPGEHYDMMPNVIGAGNVLEALNITLSLAAAGFRVVLDSLRSLVYKLDGTTMAGGMSSGIFDAVTTFSNMFAENGTSAILAINPMLANTDDAARLYVRIASACAGAIHLEDSGKVTAQTARLMDGRSLDLTAKAQKMAAGEGSRSVYLNLQRLPGGDTHNNLAAMMNAGSSRDFGDDDDITPRHAAPFDL